MNHIPSYLLHVYSILGKFFALPEWEKRIGFGGDICGALAELHELHKTKPDTPDISHLSQVYAVLKNLFGSPNWENRIGTSGDINSAIRELHKYHKMGSFKMVA
jgi:hypothetical protein